MVDVPVNKDVLVWARMERGLSEEEAAKRLKLSIDELSALERGTRQPSMAVLDKMATKYRIPFASLMMPEPLPLIKRPADFRTFEGQDPIWDDQLLVAIDVVEGQLELFSELREQDPDLFKGNAPRSYDKARKAIDVATEERTALGLKIEDQFGWPTGAQAFRYWRHLVERNGIFVQILDLGPESLCRGLAIYDERNIPTIVINGDESEGPARTFTLLHEYGHILIRQPGISDQNRKNSTERWCNQFAAHLLMPAERFKAEALAIDPSRVWNDTAIRKIAELYNVSMSAVALHLEDVGLAKAGLYDAKLAEWQARKSNKKKSNFSDMGYPERQVHRLGVRHVGIVLEAVDKRDLNPLEAFELTEVNPKWFGDLKEQVVERQKQYGGVR